MTRSPTDPGAAGAGWERVARKHLEQSGLRLLASNVRYRFGELDLVMEDRGQLVFVEVRYRRSTRFGGSAVSVTAAKRRRLALAAQAFLGAHPPLAQRACRFDVVAVDGDAAQPRIEWIRDAFTLDDLDA